MCVIITPFLELRKRDTKKGSIDADKFLNNERNWGVYYLGNLIGPIKQKVRKSAENEEEADTVKNWNWILKVRIN